MSKRTKKTMSDQLAELTSPAPSDTFDPDQLDFDDGTGAGFSRYDDFDEGSDFSLATKQHRPSGGLRVAADMESIGQEYHGKRVSRKALEATVGDAHDPDQVSEADESSGGNDEDDDDDDEFHSGKGEGGVSSFRRKVTSLNLDDVSSSEDDNGSGIENFDGDSDGGDDGDELVEHESKRARKRVHWTRREERGDVNGGDAKRSRQQQQQSNVFAGLGAVDVGVSIDDQMMELDAQDEKARKSGEGVAGQGELRRAREALRQRQWWDSLLEVRILLQRLMNAANKLPGPNELPLFFEGDEELAALAKESARAAQGLATQLSAVRRSHMTCWGITLSDPAENSNSGESAAAANGDNDEVERRGAGDAAAAEEGQGDQEAVAAREHRSCMGWWEGVLGRWHNRTQLVDPSLQKKFRVVNQGPWAQVTASLSNRDRANRRAFMTESETADFLGRKLAKHLKAAKGDDDAESVAAAAAAADDEERGDEGALGRQRRKEGAEPLDLEVIDDRDLYQHLLKEFMDASGAAGSGQAAVSVRPKSRKKNVDRKASKGRKIKYVTHPKMQNFMFPQEYEPPPMEPSELFASLFGGSGRTR